MVHIVRPIAYSSAFPAPSQLLADWRGLRAPVTTVDKTRAFNQDIVTLESYPVTFARRFEGLRTLAGDGYPGRFVEAGFFAAERHDYTHVLGDIFTSHDPDAISESACAGALSTFLIDVAPHQIRRLQLYHTHPYAPMARTVSRVDVEQAIHTQAKLAVGGVRVPVDMHALPYDMAFLGMLEWVEPPPIGKALVTDEDFLGAGKRAARALPVPIKKTRVEFSPVLFRVTVPD